MKPIKDNDLSCLSLDTFEHSAGCLVVPANDNFLVERQRAKPIVAKTENAISVDDDQFGAEQEAACLPLLSGIVVIALAVVLGLGVFLEVMAVDRAISDAAGTAFSTSAHAMVPSGAWLLDSGL